MKGIAHLNKDGIVKIAIARQEFKTPYRGNFYFSPGVGQLTTQNAIDLMDDLQFCSNRYMVSDISYELLNKHLLKQDKFTALVEMDIETGTITWS